MRWNEISTGDLREILLAFETLYLKITKKLMLVVIFQSLSPDPLNKQFGVDLAKGMDPGIYISHFLQLCERSRQLFSFSRRWASTTLVEHYLFCRIDQNQRFFVWDRVEKYSAGWRVFNTAVIIQGNEARKGHGRPSHVKFTYFQEHHQGSIKQWKCWHE